MPFPNEASRLVLASVIHQANACVSLVLKMRWNCSIMSRAAASVGTPISIAATMIALALDKASRRVVMSLLRKRAGGAARESSIPAFSLRLCRVAHSATTRGRCGFQCKSPTYSDLKSASVLI